MRPSITTRVGVQFLWAVIATCAVIGVALSGSSRRIERLQSGHAGSLIKWMRASPAPEAP